MKPVPYVGKPLERYKDYYTLDGEIILPDGNFIEHRKTKEHVNCSLDFTWRTQFDVYSDVSPRVEVHRYE